MLPRHLLSVLSFAAVALVPAATGLAQAQPASASAPKQTAVRVEPAGSSNATEAPSMLKTIKEADEAIVIERFITRARWDADGTGVREITAVARAQSEAGVQSLAVLNFAYTTENETVEVEYVRVRKPDGIVVNTPAYNIQDMPADVTRVAPMYSDIHEKHVTVKGLGVGDTLEYVVRFRTIKPQVPGHFWFEYSFQKDAVARDEQLEIDVPKDKYVKVVSPDLQPHIREEGGRRIYTWKHSNLSRKEKDPREIPLREGPQPDVQMTSFHGWEEVGKWYAELQKPQVELTQQIRDKAAELTKGLTTDDDKIKALYRYVATRFHYISLSFGIGRYQPHSAADVLENEYGDCKDKHTLLAALLKATGYEAWPAAIHSTRKINPDVPSPGQFDHVITVLPRGNSLLWLDSTPEVAPFGMLMANLRDKQALVMPAEKPASLIKTPENPPFPTVQTFVAEGKLGTDGTFIGHVQRSSRGDMELILRLAFRGTSQGQWKELAQRLSYLAGFGGDVDAITATKPEDTDEPFDFSYDYTRKEYSDWKNRRITPPLPPFGIEAGQVDEKKPQEPFLLGAPGEIVYRARMDLPTGYSAVAPKNVDLLQPFAEYHATYSIEKGVLTAVRRLTIKQKEVPLSAWDDYKAFRRSLTDDEEQYIVLNGGDSETARGENSNGSEADRKFREGADAMKRADFKAARDAFQRVIEMNPKYRGAHLSLAIALVTSTDPRSSTTEKDRAIAEAAKELELYPDDTRATQFLAFLFRDNPEKADLQWRRVLAADPSNRVALNNLTQSQMKTGKYLEAVSLLETALAKSPDDPDLKNTLADAYLRSGQKEKGLALLKERVAADQSPDTLNTVSYIMAEADLELSLAREYAEKAVRQFEATSVQDGLSEKLGLITTRQLYATWDTLGWIYFKTGELDRAARYLRAAWELSQAPVPADHLGQVYERQNKKTEAARMYRLALAGARPGNDETRKRYKQLTGQSPDLYSIHRRADGTWTPSPGEELSRMRTFTFKATGKFSGSAVYSVTFTPAKTDTVKFVSGDESLRGLETHIAAINFKNSFPDEGPVKLFRQGIVTCTGASCTFVLFQPEDTFVGERN